MFDVLFCSGNNNNKKNPMCYCSPHPSHPEQFLSILSQIHIFGTRGDEEPTVLIFAFSVLGHSLLLALLQAVGCTVFIILTFSNNVCFTAQPFTLFLIRPVLSMVVPALPYRSPSSSTKCQTIPTLPNPAHPS